MTPIRFTVKNGITTFHYKTSELINFARLGFKHGDVGMILVRREGGMLTYKGFGTIENPFTYLVRMSVMHFPQFHGEMPTDEQRLIPPKPFFATESTRFVMFDLSDKNIISDRDGR
jgi:hypothetical protein